MGFNFVLGVSVPFEAAYTVSFGDVSALKPEWWALEGLVVLEEQLVAANLVNKDYNNYFVNAGDTVHVHRPGTFTAKHKVKGETVTTQTATATGDTVKLNQHIEVTFNLDDRDLQASLRDLRTMFLVPALRAISEGMDKAVVGEAAGFGVSYAAGQLGVPLTADALIRLGLLFDENNVPSEGRNLIVGPSGKADILNIERFTRINETGYPGNSIISGLIGEAMGFNTFMSQTVGSTMALVSGNVDVTRDASAASKGAQTITVTQASSEAITAGMFFTIAGTDGIYCATGAVDATGTSISFYPPLHENVDASSQVTVFLATGVVDGNVAAGQNKVVTDGYAAASEIPVVGQAVSFGTGGVAAGTAPTVYTVTAVSGTWASSSTDITLTLNRPLDVAITDGQAVNMCPVGGGYNFALRPDAVTLVNRPLAPAFAGVAATTQNNGEYALRVTIGYDQDYMMHKITVDTLLGVKSLDPYQGAVLLN